MSITFYQKKTDYLTKTPILNCLELLYLRLYIHDFKTKEISNFLELELTTVQKLRSAIVFRYKETNWVKLICRAFKNNTLQKTDYVRPIVKELALINTQIIYENYVLTKPKVISYLDLKNHLLEFYSSCEMKLCEQYDDKPEDEKLDHIEREFLKRKWEKVDYKIFDHQVSTKYYNAKQNLFKNTVFNKLEVNNWFNAYKKSFELKILDLPSNHLTCLDNHIKNCSNRISKLKHAKSLLAKEKKLSIYNELVELYANIEFSKLVSHDDGI